MQLLDRQKKCLAQGETGTNSKRASAYIENVYPTHISHGEGCCLIDTNGKRYIDFVSGLGTNILGYNHPKVMDGVSQQLKRGGPSFSLPHYLELEVAELIKEMVPSAEKVRFLKTGNEATLAANRIAQMHGKGIRSNGYHGHGDLWTSLTPPRLGVNDRFDIAEYKQGEWKGNIILEPIQLDASDARKEWLHNIKTNCVLIFDEIVTGFRVPKYTVSSWWDMKPGLICLGKAIANGFPLALVAGKKEVMDCGEYFVSSTYSGEAMSLAAAKATLTELKTKNMNDLIFYGKRFCDRFNEICKPIGSKIEGYGSRGQTDFYENEKTVLLFQECCKAGILFGRAFFWNFAHMEAGIEEQVLSIVSDAVRRIELGRVKLEGKPPMQTFKR